MTFPFFSHCCIIVFQSQFHEDGVVWMIVQLNRFVVISLEYSQRNEVHRMAIVVCLYKLCDIHLQLERPKYVISQSVNSKVTNLIELFIHLFIHLFSHLFIHSFIHSFIHDISILNWHRHIAFRYDIDVLELMQTKQITSPWVNPSLSWSWIIIVECAR
jgi:hypothetical protein